MALWDRKMMAGKTNGSSTSGNHPKTEFGYGLRAGSRLVGTAWFGFGA